MDRTTKTHYQRRQKQTTDSLYNPQNSSSNHSLHCLKENLSTKAVILKKQDCHYTIISDPTSGTSPLVPNIPISESSVSTTSHSSNLTPVTPSKRQRSQLTNTSTITYSSITNRPPKTEIPIITRSQTSPVNTPLVHIPNPEYVERYVNYKPSTAIKTVRHQPQLNLVHIPDSEYTQLPPLHLPSEISTTLILTQHLTSNTYPNTASSKLYPPLKSLRKPSTSLSNLLDSTSDYISSQESTSSLFVPYHRYNLRNFPSRRLSAHTTTLNLSALSSNSALRLARQHAQPLSDTQSSELVPQSKLTSGLDTASLFSSDAQTAYLSGHLFSEVKIPTPVPAHIRLPEFYTAEHSRPLTPNFVDYPIRVDGITIHNPKHHPRFPILTERFITTNDHLSNKRKETELKRLQFPNLELKFEVKVKFQGLNLQPVFHVAKIEHNTTPVPFEVVHIDLERDPQLLDLTYGKIVF